MSSSETLDLFLDFIEAGGVAEGGFWEIIYQPAQRGSEETCKAISHYLERCLARSLKNGLSNPFSDEQRTLLNSQIAPQIFEDCAERAPEAFIDAVLYWVLMLVMLNKKYFDNGIWRDEIWPYDYWRAGHKLEDALLQALEKSLKSLAESDPNAAKPYLSLLRSFPYVTAQKLLCATCIAAGTTFVDEAFDYLMEDPSRLESERNGSFAWGARDLIVAIEPALSNKQFLALEELVLSYYSDWEYRYHDQAVGSAHPATDLGKTQLILLDGLPFTRLSQKALRRLGEWRRKFDYERSTLRQPRPLGGMAQFVGSPIGDNQAAHMTDEQWLSAIARYSGEETTWDWNNYTSVGGARQLASVLERLTQRNPARFARLLQQFSDDAHEVYFDAVLRGATKSSAGIDTIMIVIERCYRLPGQPVARQICWTLRDISRHQLPERAWEIIADLATCHPDPAPDSSSFANDRYPDGGLHAQCINSVRGSAAEVVAEMIFDNPAAVTYFQSTLAQLVNDPSVSVRSCVACALTHLLRHDRDKAVELFLQLVDVDDDRLLCSHFVEMFLYYALQTHLEQLAPVVTRMLASENEDVAFAGAVRGCLVELVQGEAEHGWTELCLEGSGALRTGATEVFAANITVAHHREICQANLIVLFSDEDSGVRKAAAGCFRTIGGEMIGEYFHLVQAFVESPTFSEESNDLFFALDEAKKSIPELTCLVCEAWLNDATLFAPDSQGWFAGVNNIENLVVRTYTQAMQGMDVELQSRGLDLVDKMLESGTFHQRQVLTEFER